MKHRNLTHYMTGAFLLTLLVLSSSACAQTQAISEKVTDNVTASGTMAEATAAVQETEKSLIPPEIEAVDYGGDTLTIMTRAVSNNYCYPYEEFLSEGENGDPINDAVWKRNTVIEDKYNLKLEVLSSSALKTMVSKTVIAGDNAYDLVFPMHYEACMMSRDGHLYDASSLPHIDLSKAWWRTSMMEGISIDGRNYFLTGDLNLSSLNGVGVVFFNKSLADTLDCGNLYDIVESGDWTFDTLQTLCHGVTRDLDGDQNLTRNDMFGLTTNAFAWQPFFAGMGKTLIEKDSNDHPILRWDDQENISALERVLDFVDDESAVLLTNRHKEIPQAEWGTASIEIFTADRALFWIEIIYGSLTLRDMDTDFGILPMPKQDAAQKNYASYMHVGHTATTAIPITNDDPDRMGRIIEDMAYQSSLTVRPAYYEFTLKGKISRDEASVRMLDLIYSNINLDLAILMSNVLPIDKNMRAFLAEGSRDFMSVIASEKNNCLTEINDYVKALADVAANS